MPQLLNFIRRPGDSAPMYVAPEDIVREAERRGRIKIERSWSKGGAYEAQIHFTNSSGSTIWATGNDTDFFTAIAKAVQEAERLK